MSFSPYNRLRGAIIGAGYFSQFQYEAWTRIPEVEIVAASNRTVERAEEKCGQYGISRAYKDWREMIETEKPDFVDIITPPPTHLEICRYLAERNIHMICQKPLAPSYEESEALAKIAGNTEARFMVHENFRWQPWYRKVKELLNDGTLGDLFSIYFLARMGRGRLLRVISDRPSRSLVKPTHFTPNTMSTEQKVSASEVIFHYFKEKIKSGALQPGDPLPSERTLQKQLGVSRFSLREGLARLNAIGVIDTQHGKTTRVSQGVNTDSLKNVFLPFQSHADTQSRSDLYEARMVLEAELASLAAKRRTAKDIEGLRLNLEQAEASIGDENIFGSLDLEFHERIANAAGNRFFKQMHAVIRDQLEPVMKLHANAEDQRRMILRKHTELFNAIEDRNPAEARQMARDHLGVFKTHYT
jgi:DNA-binding FadR family transcriptional regulator